MARTDDDSWDLASSVGVTATIVAAGRAMATKDPRGLINDPFAEPLVRAVGLDFFTKMMDGELDMSTSRTSHRPWRRRWSTETPSARSTLTTTYSAPPTEGFDKW